jgi:hypothetical protein
MTEMLNLGVSVLHVGTSRLCVSHVVMEQSPTTTTFWWSSGHKPQIAWHGSEDAVALALAHRPH